MSVSMASDGRGNLYLYHRLKSQLLIITNDGTTAAQKFIDDVLAIKSPETGWDKVRARCDVGDLKIDLVGDPDILFEPRLKNNAAGTTTPLSQQLLIGHGSWISKTGVISDARTVFRKAESLNAITDPHDPDFP